MKGLQIRTAMRGLFLTLAFLAVLAVAAQALGATWPHRQVNVATCFDRTTLQVAYAKCEYFSRSYQWQNFILLGFIVEFLLLKAWMMGAMTTAWDWLGSSLIATNVAFALVYLYAMAVTLFPKWGSNTVPRDAIRYGLIVVLAWTIWQLLRVPDLEPWDGEAERRSGEERRADWCEEGV